MKLLFIVFYTNYFIEFVFPNAVTAVLRAAKRVKANRLDRLNIDVDWTVMFDFHESLMRPSDLFSRDWAQMQLFSCRSWHTRFPLELEIPRLSPLSWLNSIELNACYATEDAIKKSRRKLKVGGWSKFNLILPVKALRFKLKGLHAASRMIQRSCLLHNNHVRKYSLILRWDIIDRDIISFLNKR